MSPQPEPRQPEAGDARAEGLEGSETYAAALAELEDLLDELEGTDIDVDRLAERVARGAELVRFCRARLDVVTKDVDLVVSELVTADEMAEDSP